MSSEVEPIDAADREPRLGEVVAAWAFIFACLFIAAHIAIAVFG